MNKFLVSCVLISCSFLVFANEQDDRIIALTKQSSSLTAGKELFEQICASCHAKDLSGASGFNLKDGEWIHGNKPSDIVSNIQNGFMTAGMPGFGQIFAESQIESIAAYILSKREGWEDLTYKIYQLSGEGDNKISSSKLVKSGQAHSNFADFAMPEMKHYALVFEGNFYTDKDQVTKLWTGRPKHIDISLEIDGIPVKRSHEWNPTWVLNKGKQHLKLTIKVHDLKYWERNVPLIVTNHDLSIKLFSASTEGRRVMSGKKVELKATNNIIVHRKKVHSIPAYSISVGLPEKLNYAFNTRSCSIVGMWQGEMLNVGPNVSARGQDGSLPLGKWVFKSPEVLGLSADATCKYKGYQFKNEPKFKYKVDGRIVELTAHAVGQNTLSFNYKITDKQPISFTLPNTEGVEWQSPQGKVSGTTMTVKPNAKGSFSILAQIKK